MTRSRRPPPARRSTWRLPARVGAAVGSALVLGGLLAGCGQQTTDSSAAEGLTAGSMEAGAAAADEQVARLAKGEPRPELTCPTGERKSMIADLAPGARGAPTPEEALDDQRLRDGERVLVTANGSTAWVLRPDGTASEVIGLTEADGWFVTQRTSCG